MRSICLPVVLLFVVFAASPLLAQTQRFDVTGTVVDSTDAGLSGATVVVLESDSTLVSFGITRPDGAFRIERVPSGSHLLQITFIGFAPHSQEITLTDGPLDVGRIVLDEAVAELGELVVRADHVPMVVNRDTLEYNVAAFGVPLNANVEDLLKRLPGIEVDPDGTIRAQGEQVRQVLVDGREFFGNDPTVATRNLPAEAVDRVQVYDQRSDRAEFTGVDDGEEERTINLALRPERRQGYFGNASAALGDPSRYEGRTSVNRFSPGTQLSLISNVNNINEQGFSMRDYASFMGGMQALIGEGGQLNMGNVPLNRGMGDGFATTISGGLNFNHEFSSATSIRASYMGYYVDQEQNRGILQRELAGATAASFSDQQTDQLSRQQSHRLNLNATHTFSDGHDIRLRSNFQMSDGDLHNLTARETRNDGDELENTNQTDFRSSSETLNGDAVLTYRRRFAPGRTITAELSSGINDGNVAGNLAALTHFYNEGNVLTTEEIAQLQSQLSNTFTRRQRLTYTEPLGTRQLLQFDVEHRATIEDQERTVFDDVGNVPVWNGDLSSGFERTYRYYKAGVNFRSAIEPLTLRFGVDVQQANIEGAILHVNEDVARSFLNVLPSATIGYAFSGTRNLQLQYNTSTREPSMRDLQPFADNSDPLNVYIGNPNLRPEYRHNVALRFMFFDPFTSTNVFAFVNGRYTLDPIARSRTIDEHRRQTVTMINAANDWSITGQVSYGTLVRPLGVRVNVSNQSVFNRGVEFINSAANTTNILRSTFELRLDNRDKEVLDAHIGTRFTFNDVRYSLNAALNQGYVNRTFFGEVGYQLAERWRATTAADYTIYASGVFGSARHIPLVRASVSHMVMDNRGEIRLEVRDLLNQNVGVNYSNTSTYIQEERIDSLGRFVMLRFVYNLAGRGQPPGGQVIHTRGG